MNARTTNLGEVVQNTRTCGCLACEGASAAKVARAVPGPLLKLQREHETVLKETGYLSAVMKQISQERNVTRRLRSEATSTLKRLKRLLSTHQAREEQILLPIIATCLDSEACENIHSEHLQVSKVFRRMSTSLATLKRRSWNGPLDSVSKSIADFDALTRAHFSREENVLFWFVSICPSESDLQTPAAKRWKSES